MFQTRFGLQYLHARAGYYLAVGKAESALGDILACADRMRVWELDHPALVPWRTEAAAAYLQLGDCDRARQLAQEQLARFGGRSRGLALRILATIGERRRRPELLNEAVDVFEQSGDRLELARALADLDYAHRALGDDDRARHAQAHAVRVARECRAEPILRALLDSHSEQLPDEGQAEPAGGSAPSVLSGAEQRVAFLAALGHSNREIASQLFITVSTVEQHLTRVYRKLDVRNRKDLTGQMPTDVVTGP
jgi:DNA-binding CsgD family transcriptional regulator